MWQARIDEYADTPIATLVLYGSETAIEICLCPGCFEQRAWLEQAFQSPEESRKMVGQIVDLSQLEKETEDALRKTILLMIDEKHDEYSRLGHLLESKDKPTRDEVKGVLLVGQVMKFVGEDT